jgi:hypothetical protein
VHCRYYDQLFFEIKDEDLSHQTLNIHKEFLFFGFECSDLSSESVGSASTNATSHGSYRRTIVAHVNS